MEDRICVVGIRCPHAGVYSIALVCLVCKVVGFACTRNARTVQTGQSPAIGCGCHRERGVRATWQHCSRTPCSVRERRGNSARPWADSWYSCETPAPPPRRHSSSLSQALSCLCVRALELVSGNTSILRLCLSHSMSLWADGIVVGHQSVY